MMRTTSIAVLMAGLLAACSAPVTDDVRVLQTVTQQTILPMHADFVSAARELKDDTAAFCAAPDDNSFNTAQNAWRTAMQDWQRLQVVSFGPVTVDNQAWRVQFWPDRNNLIRQKIESLLASNEALTAAKLEADSVVIQGLSAAEYLLFDEQGGALPNYLKKSPEAVRRCELLQLISAHTLAVATRLSAGWAKEGGDYSAVFTVPGTDNPDFADSTDALAALFDSILAALEVAKNDKLADAMGLRNELGIAQPYAVEAWRSRYSLPLIAASINGARQLYSAGPEPDAFGIDDLLRAKGAVALADTIEQQFAAVQAATPVDLVLFDAVNLTEHTDELTEYYDAMTSLVQTLKNEVPSVLGITLGFNDKDGD
ncbi:MAG: imelysin family protein [Woeseia sp.]